MSVVFRNLNLMLGGRLRNYIQDVAPKKGIQTISKMRRGFVRFCCYVDKSMKFNFSTINLKKVKM